MKKVNYIVAAAAVILVVILSSVQPRKEKGPPTYNAAAEVTVSGVVEETREFFCPVTDDQGAHLVLRTREGKVLVHLAPARFLRTQQFAFHANDEVQVIGTRIRYQGQDAMLARELTRGNEVLILRDHQGQPAWNR